MAKVQSLRGRLAGHLSDARSAEGLRRRVTNIGHLLSGNMLNAAIMLVSASIAARSLGPHVYGIMVLVLSFCRTVERVVRFESWQPLIKYAAEPGTADDKHRLSQLYLYGLILDVGAAMLATAAAVIIALLIGPLFGMSWENIALIAIYSLTILFNISGMPTAALRFSGHFRTIAYSQLSSNIMRVALAIVCGWYGWGVVAFVSAWAAAQIFGSLIFLFLGFRSLAIQQIPSPFMASARSLRTNFPGFLSFAWSSNLSMTLRTLSQEADSLLVGAFWGPAAAGYYYIARRLANVSQQVGGQIQAVIYPDVARMWAQGKIRQFRATTLQVQVIMGVFGLLMLAIGAVFGEWIIRLGPGGAYTDAYPLLLTQLVAVILIMHGAPSRSAMLAMGLHRQVLFIAMGSLVLFLVVACTLVPLIGPIGANIAHIALGAFSAILLDRRWMKEVRFKGVTPWAGGHAESGTVA
ncbi:MAG: lipopolysaccharide biosynthesis protein [Sphingomonadales bacterium]|nr:lipopolysaccharide biosynthesis protein [Sphingomonadales bacterium]